MVSEKEIRYPIIPLTYCMKRLAYLMNEKKFQTQHDTSPLLGKILDPPLYTIKKQPQIKNIYPHLFPHAPVAWLSVLYAARAPNY